MLLPRLYDSHAWFCRLVCSINWDLLRHRPSKTKCEAHAESAEAASLLFVAENARKCSMLMMQYHRGRPVRGTGVSMKTHIFAMHRLQAEARDPVVLSQMHPRLPTDCGIMHSCGRRAGGQSAGWGGDHGAEGDGKVGHGPGHPLTAPAHRGGGRQLVQRRPGGPPQLGGAQLSSLSGRSAGLLGLQEQIAVAVACGTTNFQMLLRRPLPVRLSAGIWLPRLRIPTRRCRCIWACSKAAKRIPAMLIPDAGSRCSSVNSPRGAGCGAPQAAP